MKEAEMNSDQTATSQSYAQPPMTPGEALADVRQALDGGMGGMDDTAAWWYERAQVLVAEIDTLYGAAAKAERYLASLPDNPEPGDPWMVNVWAALRKAVRPYERV